MILTKGVCCKKKHLKINYIKKCYTQVWRAIEEKNINESNEGKHPDIIEVDDP